jgi:hypothetical protein
MADDPDGKDRNTTGSPDWNASETAQFESLQIDLELCLTFVDSANREYGIGDSSGALQARTKAELGYSAINRLALNLEDPAHRKKIQMGLDELRVALDELTTRSES